MIVIKHYSKNLNLIKPSKTVKHLVFDVEGNQSLQKSKILAHSKSLISMHQTLCVWGLQKPLVFERFPEPQNWKSSKSTILSLRKRSFLKFCMHRKPMVFECCQIFDLTQQICCVCMLGFRGVQKFFEFLPLWNFQFHKRQNCKFWQHLRCLQIKSCESLKNRRFFGQRKMLCIFLQLLIRCPKILRILGNVCIS